MNPAPLTGDESLTRIQPDQIDRFPPSDGVGVGRETVKEGPNPDAVK